jgi:hypothetical protein
MESHGGMKLMGKPKNSEKNMWKILCSSSVLFCSKDCDRAVQHSILGLASYDVILRPDNLTVILILKGV